MLGAGKGTWKTKIKNKIVLKNSVHCLQWQPYAEYIYHHDFINVYFWNSVISHFILSKKQCVKYMIWQNVLDNQVPHGIAIDF